MKRLVCMITIALVISFMLFGGCTREEKRIRVGVMTPLTGNVSKWGEMQRMATELALAEINSAGGVKGRKVEVIYEDDQADPRTGVNAFKKLVETDGVPIVVGSPASNVTLAVAPIANERKVVLLSSGSTATEVGKAGPHVFRIMPSDEVQSSIMADWALELGYRKVAMIFEENAWGRGLMEAFMKDFPAKGGTVLTTQATEPGATDFRTQLSKIKSLEPDAIFAPVYPRGAGLMVKQAREMGITQQILGADVYNTPELIQAGGTAVYGVLYTTYGQYDGPEYQAFADKWKEKYEVEFDFYATYCYDAFKIAVEAIRRIPDDKEISGPNIREALLSISDYLGVTGVSDFSGNNSASGKTFDKMTVIQGEHVPYQP